MSASQTTIFSSQRWFAIGKVHGWKYISWHPYINRADFKENIINDVINIDRYNIHQTGHYCRGVDVAICIKDSFWACSQSDMSCSAWKSTLEQVVEIRFFFFSYLLHPLFCFSKCMTTSWLERKCMNLDFISVCHTFMLYHIIEAFSGCQAMSDQLYS